MIIVGKKSLSKVFHWEYGSQLCTYATFNGNYIITFACQLCKMYINFHHTMVMLIEKHNLNQL